MEQVCANVHFNPGISFRSCIVPNLIAFYILSLFSLQSLFQVGPHLTQTGWRVPGLLKSMVTLILCCMCHCIINLSIMLTE